MSQRHDDFNMNVAAAGELSALLNELTGANGRPVMR